MRDAAARALAPICALLLSLIALALSWFSREFTHDDFYLAYLAWIRSTDLIPGRDYIVPNFTPLAELSAPLFAAFPESLAPLDILRLPIFLASLGLLGLTYETARRLSGSRAWGGAAACVVAWHPQVILRIADVRSDAIAAAVLLVAVVLLLADENRPLLVALCGGAAAVLSPKLLLASPFLALAVLIRNRHAPLPAILRMVVGFAAVPLVYATTRITMDGWETVRSVISGVGGAVGDAAATSRMRLLINLAIPYDVAALVILGAVLLFAASRSDQTESAPARVYAILVIAFVVAFVALNPAAYVYNAVILVPLLAPLLGGIGRLTRRLPVADTAALALVALLTVTGGLHAMETVIERNSADQRNTLDWMWENTAPEERAFDWQGMHFGRLGVHHWWTYRGMLGPYRAGAYRLEDEWRRAPVTLVLHTYRLQWLTGADSAFLRDHFVSIAPCASVPGYIVSGAELRGGSRFEIFAEGIYETRPGAPVLIDGRPAPRRLRLARGVHTIEAAPGVTPPAVFGLRYRGARRRLPPCGDEPLLRPFILSSSRW